MSNIEPLAQLYTALSRAIAKAGAVEKDKKVTFGQQYDYASADAIIAEARGALAGEGLGLLPASQTRRDQSLDRAWLLTHSSGCSMRIELTDWPIIPDRGRPMDKALAAALTTSESYVLRDLLLLPRVAKGDDITGRNDEHIPAPEPAAAKPAPKALEKPPAPAGGPKKRSECETFAQWLAALGKAVLDHAMETGGEGPTLGDKELADMAEEHGARGWSAESIKAAIGGHEHGVKWEVIPMEFLPKVTWVLARTTPQGIKEG